MELYRRLEIANVAVSIKGFTNCHVVVYFGGHERIEKAGCTGIYAERFVLRQQFSCIKEERNPLTMKYHGCAHELCLNSGVKATAWIPTIYLVDKSTAMHQNMTNLFGDLSLSCWFFTCNRHRESSEYAEIALFLVQIHYETTTRLSEPSQLYCM